jgi:hypothetical protein
VTEGVYSLFEVRPDAAGKLQRRRRARFHIKDAQVTHLEDLDDELSGVPEGPLTPESATAIRKLSGPHRQLVRWTPEYGDDPGHLPEFTPPKPFVPIYPTPPTTPLIPGTGLPPWRQWYTTTDRTSDDCAIRRYFRDNPDKTYVHMVCNCRLCTIQC